MSKAIKCDGTDCPEWLPEASYATDGREWIEVLDRLDSTNTHHYHSVRCLYTYAGGTVVDEATGIAVEIPGRATSYRTTT